MVSAISGNEHGRPEILEAGLRIRPWRASDADAVYRACQDPEIQRWTAIPRPYRREDADNFVTTMAERGWAEGTCAPLGVFDAMTGELLGANGLGTWQRQCGTAEIGYWVAPWARGQGVASSATRAVARWSLATLGLARLQWRAEIGNYASLLVAERTGFRREGIGRNAVTRADGSHADCWISALLPGQLLAAGTPNDPRTTSWATTFGHPTPHLTARTHRGEQITLRPPAQRDLNAIVLACQDPESVRWTTVPHPYQRTDAEFFVRHAASQWLGGLSAIFAVVGPDDSYAGSMDLRLHTPDTADVGYLIAPTARGRGYAAAALARLCQWGFDNLGLHRVEWRAYVGNHASRRVAERAGFTMEGIARDGCPHRGEYRDAWTGSLLTTDTTRAPHPVIT